jgi:hypothetical protein
MRKISNKKFIRNNSGFLIADFLFAFVMVIGIGVFVFALTFSLATIEVGQYIVWSTARNYAAGNISEKIANSQAIDKFGFLIDQFPLLTNSDGNSSWFELSKDDLRVGELDEIDPGFNISSDDKKNNFRQPWTGVSTSINLKLFAGLNLPFLGKVANDQSAFKFPIRAFLLRNVAIDECQRFFYSPTARYSNGIMKLEGGKLAPAAFGPDSCSKSNTGGCGEDQGC